MIFGVRLYLDSETSIPNATDIGLYEVADTDSEFRWIEEDISAYTPNLEWATDILTVDPIGDISEDVELIHGGNTPAMGGCEVRLSNTVDYDGSFMQFDKLLDDNDIRLNGLRIDIVEFEIVDGTLANPAGTVRYRGVCESPQWTESQMTIPVWNALLKRRSNIGIIITENNYPYAEGTVLGKTVPVTIGRFVPEFDTNGNDVYSGYAKFLRVANKREYFKWNFPLTTFTTSPLLQSRIDEEDTAGMDRLWFVAPRSKIDEAEISAGEKTISVERTEPFVVGDLVRIRDMDGDEHYPWSQGIPRSWSESEELTVTAVDSTAKTVTVETGPDDAYSGDMRLYVSGASNGLTKVFSLQLCPPDVYQGWWIDDVNQTTGTIDLTDVFGDYCLEIIDGVGTKQCRRVSSALVDLSANHRAIEITVDEVFETKPRGDWEGLYLDGSDYNSWGRLVKIHYDYADDVWDCAAYRDSEGDVRTAEPFEVYAYAQPGTAQVGSADEDAPVIIKPQEFYQLPGNAVEDATDSTWNKLTVDSDQIDPLSENLNAFLILPMREVVLCREPAILKTAGRWAKIFDYDYQALTNGFYRHGALVPATYNVIEAREYFTEDAASGQKNIVVARGGAFKAGQSVLINDSTPGNNETNSVASVSGDTVTMTNNLAHDYQVSQDALVTTMGAIDEGRLNDQNAQTYLELSFSGYTDTKGGVAISGTFPDFPKKFLFDTMYLGLKAYQEHVGTANHTTRLYVAVMGLASIRKMIKEYGPNTGKDIRFENLPDWYYTANTPDDASKWFWSKIDDTVGSDEVYSGYSNYPIPLDAANEAAFKRINKFLIFCEVRCSAPYTGFRFRLYDVACIFKKSVSIADALYQAVDGRTFADTWGGRKTAASPILNPIDAAEHICRLLNWSEENDTSYDWGHEYPANVLVDTSSSEGGFDYEDLAGTKNYQMAWQLTDYERTASDAMLRSLCREYFLVQYTHPTTGEESINTFVERSLTTPTTTITLSDIIGDIEPVGFASPEGIYCEPVIRYGRNPATDSYDRVIRVMRTSESVYSSDYVVGLTGTEAELAWTRGHVLWEAYRQVEEPPEDLTDCPSIHRLEDAIRRLDTWYSWMGAMNSDGTANGVFFEPKRRIGFTVPYSVGKSWHLTQHHKLQLPHQTNNTAIEFSIEKYRKVLKRGQEAVQVQAILYGGANEIDLYVQDTWTQGTIQADWQDHMDTYAERCEGGDDIQDIT